jgi:hypothetical protein
MLLAVVIGDWFGGDKFGGDGYPPVGDGAAGVRDVAGPAVHPAHHPAEAVAQWDDGAGDGADTLIQPRRAHG